MLNLLEDCNHFTDKLDSQEIEALSWYTSNGSSVLNMHLTNTSPEFYLHDYIDGETDEEFEAREKQAEAEHIAHLNTTVAHLDEALHKGRRETPLKLYRGVSGDVMVASGYKEDGDNAKYVADKFPIGGTFTSDVFMSATMDRSVSENFGTSGITLEVLGKTVAPVSNVSAWGVAEREYILPRNLTYTVKNVIQTKDQWDDDVYVIQLEEA